MKKIIPALLLGIAMCLGLGGCSSGSDNELVIGITENVPMNYHDDKGDLIGFETEFTKAVCEKLGVTPKFQPIEWTKKEIELKSKTIDLIWNGLTVTEDRKKDMLFTKSYMKNKQATVVKKENADKYPDLASMAGITIAFEGGSAAEDVITSEPALSSVTQIKSAAQKDALLEVKSGKVDACMIDYTMAKAATAAGTDFSDLVVLENIDNTDEEYAIGGRLE
ncbi:MAG: transporter substrate-binding domain-containing protein, partial [Oscillospiraceae bacterium]|nr:transporter substrate-binding domain-containing protein [Oscillospiraceae bacterium]